MHNAHNAPCHHTLEKLLDEYIAAAGIAGDPDGPDPTLTLVANSMFEGCSSQNLP